MYISVERRSLRYNKNNSWCGGLDNLENNENKQVLGNIFNIICLMYVNYVSFLRSSFIN